MIPINELQSKIYQALNSLDKIDKIKIDDTMYKVLSQRKLKNKTSFFLEVEND